MFFLKFARVSAARGLQWLGWLATLAMLAVLAWLGARIFWSLNTPTTPVPTIAIETDAVRAAQTAAARHLFGEAPAPGAAAAVVQKSTLPDITLRGVIAPVRAGQPAVAVLAIAGKTSISVREGEEAAPGVTVHRVFAREVQIKHNGQIQSLSLPERGKPGADKPQDTGSAPSSAPPHTAAVPASPPSQSTSAQPSTPAQENSARRARDRTDE